MTGTTDTFMKPYERMTDSGSDPERLRQLEFHIQSGDYFPLLATVLGFLEEGMRECETGTLTLAPVEAEVIENFRRDLIHLHKNYTIAPKAGD